MAQTYSLPPLPFAYDALEPVISTQIMELHHAKHHNTYVANLNKALQDQMEAIKAGNIRDQVNLHAIISFNAGGHINHSLFWANLAPLGAPETKVDAAPKLWEAIRQRWGEDDGVFRQKFSEALLGIRGSGWAWLVRQGTQGPLAIVTTHDQDIVAKDEVPIFGIDMWEHAYYLQVRTGFGITSSHSFITFWFVPSLMSDVESILGGSVDAFKDLRASI